MPRPESLRSMVPLGPGGPKRVSHAGPTGRRSPISHVPVQTTSSTTILPAGTSPSTPPPHESRWCGARCPGSPTRVQGRPASRSTQVGPVSTLRTNGASGNPRSPRTHSPADIFEEGAEHADLHEACFSAQLEPWIRPVARGQLSLAEQLVRGHRGPRPSLEISGNAAEIILALLKHPGWPATSPFKVGI